MPNLKVTVLACLLVSFCLPATATIKKTHSSADLSTAAEDFLRAYTFESIYPVEFDVRAPSNRLKLEHCEQDIEVSFSPNAKHYGKTHLRAQCPSGTQWKINIGVELKVFYDTVVMKHSLGRGVIIGADDLTLEKHPRSKIYTDFYSQKEKLVGLVTTMPLRSGQIVSSRTVSAANLIHKGQSVMLIARSGGINITTRGKALNSAQRGETVRVQNKDSGRIVEGIAVDAGKIEILL